MLSVCQINGNSEWAKVLDMSSPLFPVQACMYDDIHTHNTRQQNELHIVGTKHTFAKQCLKHNLPKTLNSIPKIVKDKIGTHSFRGFINYAKDSFIKKYKIHCEVTNCYTCMRN